MGFSCVPVAQLAEKGSWDEISSRFEAIRQNPNQNNVSAALLGVIEEPEDRYPDALQIYIDGPAKIELAKKSADQYRKWIAIPKRAIKVFQSVVGDKPLKDLTRSDAVSFCRYWLEKIAPMTTRSSLCRRHRLIDNLAN